MGPVGEPRGDLRGWMQRQAVWLDASRSETVGLAILLAGAVVASVVLWWTGAPRGAEPPRAEAPVAVQPAPVEPLHVHVAGEVARPGVVRLAPGARVADALRSVGGPTPMAALDGLNLARELSDGEQILVPSRAGPAAQGAAGADADVGAGSGAWRPDGKLDLNRATASDLEELPGIGPVLAARIIDHREAHGPFAEIGDLRAVSGIGERTFQSLVELITV